jgi:hypothetical protein
MIVLADRILVGRKEKEVGRNGVPVMSARGITAKVLPVFRKQVPNRMSLMNNHNVVALIGRFGAWGAFEWQVWDGLGEQADPGLVGLVRCDHRGLRIVDVDAEDPVILHRSWNVLPGGDEDEISSGNRIPLDIERLRRLGLLLEDIGVAGHPLAARRAGFARLLRESGRRIDGWGLIEAA